MSNGQVSDRERQLVILSEDLAQQRRLVVDTQSELSGAEEEVKRLKKDLGAAKDAMDEIADKIVQVESGQLLMFTDPDAPSGDGASQAVAMALSGHAGQDYMEKDLSVLECPGVTSGTIQKIKAELKIGTVGHLAKIIEGNSSDWHKTVPGLGDTKAKNVAGALQTFMDANASDDAGTEAVFEDGVRVAMQFSEQGIDAKIYTVHDDESGMFHASHTFTDGKGISEGSGNPSTRSVPYDTESEAIEAEVGNLVDALEFHDLGDVAKAVQESLETTEAVA